VKVKPTRKLVHAEGEGGDAKKAATNRSTLGGNLVRETEAPPDGTGGKELQGTEAWFRLPESAPDSSDGEPVLEGGAEEGLEEGKTGEGGPLMAANLHGGEEAGGLSLVDGEEGVKIEALSSERYPKILVGGDGWDGSTKGEEGRPGGRAHQATFRGIGSKAIGLEPFVTKGHHVSSLGGGGGVEGNVINEEKISRPAGGEGEVEGGG
jgi:hypothetical protein